MRIDFFLMGSKGLAVLQYICASPYRHCINNVVTARDKGVLQDYTEEILDVCRQNGISFFERTTYCEMPGAAYRILIGWRWMVPETNTIVLHDALLPAYRGFAPLVNALINGEKEVGVTALWAAAQYDAGAVIAQRKMTVNEPVRINDAIVAMAGLYVQVMEQILEDICNGGQLVATPQDEAAATYSLWRDEADYFIDWKLDDRRILRTIYALSFPYHGACTLLHGRKVIIEDAIPVKDVAIVNRDPGKVLFVEEGLPVVVCGTGLLKIKAAYYYPDKKAILPLEKFRSRFGV
ncbi:MAG TPA: formyltransferase family protein [Chitinophagaceae bacterium]|nr:formyltransferase family protein [Chitinophagaceae bacterium]